MAGEQYGKVSRRMWRDEKFRQFSKAPPSARELWIYLLTSPRSTSIPGIVAVGAMGLAEDLDWPVKATRARLAELEAAGVVRVDHEAKLLWLPNSLDHNPPANASVVLGWGSSWRLLPECPLRTMAQDSIRAKLTEMDADAVRDGRTGCLFAQAFEVATGALAFADSLLKVGRPKKKADAAHESPRISEHGVPHPDQHCAEQQDQEQKQDQEQDRSDPDARGLSPDSAHGQALGAFAPASALPPPTGWTWIELAQALAGRGSEICMSIASQISMGFTPKTKQRAVMLDVFGEYVARGMISANPPSPDNDSVGVDQVGAADAVFAEWLVGWRDGVGAGREPSLPAIDQRRSVIAALMSTAGGGYSVEDLKSAARGIWRQEDRFIRPDGRIRPATVSFDLIRDASHVDSFMALDVDSAESDVAPRVVVSAAAALDAILNPIRHLPPLAATQPTRNGNVGPRDNYENQEAS